MTHRLALSLTHVFTRTLDAESEAECARTPSNTYKHLATPSNYKMLGEEGGEGGRTAWRQGGRKGRESREGGREAEGERAAEGPQQVVRAQSTEKQVQGLRIPAL